MEFLQRAWLEIRSGENLDLYITVSVAGLIALLNIIGVAPQSWLAPITLGVLSILAATSLVNRHKIENLSAQLIRPQQMLFSDEFPESMRIDLESANSLWFVGVSLGRTIKSNYTLIEKKLQQGHQVQVMLVHPKGAGLEMSAARSYVRRTLSEEGHDIQVTLGYLCGLKKQAPEFLKIRTIQYPLSYGVFAADLDSRKGVLYIENYPYRTRGESRPKFVLRPQDDKWYQQYKEEIETLWDSAVDWDCDNEYSGFIM